MSDVVIKVENLSKLYRYGQSGFSRASLREALTDAARSTVQGAKTAATWPFRAVRRQSAICNLQSQIEDDSPAHSPHPHTRSPRHLLGPEGRFLRSQPRRSPSERAAFQLIGRNGAGKSTLLKILSRITAPTCGSVSLCGRVASLLEVGTGFHPELTGRENIFLNGALLGMKKAEIDRQSWESGGFREIVAFAETEKFIDTPVKRYSSGMYVRLAFAVAAHLAPEILLVLAHRRRA